MMPAGFFVSWQQISLTRRSVMLGAGAASSDKPPINILILNNIYHLIFS